VLVNAERRQACRGEDGAALPIMALLLLVLLGMAAFAVDIGLAMNQRRQDQAAADVAALSGAYLYYVTGSVSGDAIFNEVTRISHESSDLSISLSAWRTAFRSCQDPDALADTLNTSGGVVPCISVDRAAQKFRVKLPRTEVPSVFRGAAGYKALHTTAYAVVRAQPGETNILPFGMSVGSSANGSIICLKNPPSGLAGPECKGPTTGQFNDLAIPRPYKTSAENKKCDPGFKTLFQENVAMGIDHELVKWLGGVETRDQCIGSSYPNGPATAADTVNAQTGNDTHDDTEEALLSDSAFLDGKGGRLTRTPFDTRTVKGKKTTGTRVDDKPLWEFIAKNDDTKSAFTTADVVDMTTAVLPLSTSVRNTKIPKSCRDLVEGISLQNKVNMAVCIDEYDAGEFTTDLFSADANDNGTFDLQESPRFGWLPMATINLATCGSGSNCWYHIQDFRPVYLQTMYWDGQQFNPGEADIGGSLSSSSAKKAFTGLSAFAFNLESLPQQILTDGYYRSRSDLQLVE
jgi:hypothetical protein